MHYTVEKYPIDAARPWVVFGAYSWRGQVIRKVVGRYETTAKANRRAKDLNRMEAK